MPWVAIFIFLIIISGCATTPVPVSKAKPISTDRVLEFKEPSVDRSAHIIIIRDEGMIASGCYCALYVNGILAARIDPKEKVDFYVPPGEVLLKVSEDPLGKGLCGFNLDNWIQRETIIKAGETKYFRMSISSEGAFDISRTDNDIP